MRIISGKYRGFTIVEPAVSTTRVSKERLREGLFSALFHDIKGALVLDLFAGSGSLGFEALSRGAAKVSLVDTNFECVKCMNKTIQNFKIRDKSVEVFYAAYPSALNLFLSHFDVVFLDPPYGEFDFDSIIEQMLTKNLINGGTIIVIEDLKYFASTSFSFLSEKKYKYGINHITIVKGVERK